jgi:RHS repeat-associated protein
VSSFLPFNQRIPRDFNNINAKINKMPSVNIYCSIILCGHIVCSLPGKAQDATVIKPDVYNSNMPVNFVRTWTSNAPDQNPSVVTRVLKDVKQTTLFVDGLGRPIQNVARQGSLVAGSNAVDLVGTTVYDEFGREVRKYLPFAANNTGGNSSISDGYFKLNPFDQQQYFYSDNNVNSPLKGQGETFYYGKIDYEPSQLNRMQKTFSPGNSWVHDGRAVETKYWVNTGTDAVRMWIVNDAGGGLGTYSTPAGISGIYPAGTLFKQVAKDEEGKQAIEFKDKDGRIILKKIQLTAADDNGQGAAYPGWLCTYYIYDNVNRLRAVVQPAGVDFLNTHNWDFSTNGGVILEEQCYRYQYDQRGHMIRKKEPGAAETWMVYDERDRVVLTQDGNMRLKHKWFYTQYDDKNRKIATGLWTDHANYNNLSLHLGLAKISQNYPDLNGQTYEQLTWLYYDDYSWSNSLSNDLKNFETIYANDHLLKATNRLYPYPQSVVTSAQTRGLITGSKIKVLESNPVKYITTLKFYDEKGRVIQVRSTNITDGIDIQTTQYNWSGQPLVVVEKQQKNGSNAQTTIVVTQMTYDDLNRLSKVDKKISNSLINSGAMPSAWTTILQNEYNAVGQVSRKKLGTKPGVPGTALSNLGYEYNIRGWLASINKDFITKETPDPDTYFGMQLGFNKDGFGGFPNKKYDGNISGVIWRNESDRQRRKYDFTYDKANRLTGADFNQHTSGAVFDRSALVDFSVNNLSYDPNGNILTMQQMGLKLGSSSPIDDLTYRYYDNSNQLKNVIDGSNEIHTKLGDFRSSATYMSSLGNSKPMTAIDYIYDENGNLVKDLNKDIDDANGDGIEYNHLNLPRKIRVKGKGSIDYVYDATGNKLAKIVKEGSNPDKTTLYMGGAVYENDELQFIGYDDGRIRFEKATTASCTPLPSRLVYDYYIKDHLGSIRMVLTEDQQTDCYPMATLESGRVATEDDVYNINAGRIINKANTGATQSSFENSLYRVHGGLGNEKTGLEVVLKVMSGDQVRITGESFYDLPAGSTVGAPVTMALTELLAAMAGSPKVAVKGVSSTSDISGIGTNNVALNDFINNNNAGAYTAKAAINWILFDDQFHYVTSDFDGVQANGGYKQHVKFINSPVNVTRSGYLYIYVSNESNLPVFFDNLGVTQIRGPIMETNDYYPFGLTMAGIAGSRLPSWDHAKKKFNGIEETRDLELNQYDAFFRNLDPQTGRWWQLDPRPNEMLSPYAAMANNPFLYSDPLGDTTWVFGKNGRYLGVVNDKLENQVHFLDNNGGKKPINSKNLSEEQANKLGQSFRDHSIAYIGKNTIAEMKDLAQKAAEANKEIAFVGTIKETKEIHLEGLPIDENNHYDYVKVHKQINKVYPGKEKQSKIFLAGHVHHKGLLTKYGNTYKGISLASMHGILGEPSSFNTYASYDMDYEPLLYRESGDAKGQSAALIVTPGGFTVYSTGTAGKDNQLTRSGRVVEGVEYPPAESYILYKRLK